MTTTRVFMSTDASAPVLTGQLDSLNNLLLACLVGTAGVAYGSGGTAKAAAGWTNPYTDAPNHIQVFRNSVAVGSGCYLRVQDDGTGTSATAANAHMACYATMSGVSTGTEPTPASVAGWPGARIEKAAAANSTPVPWVVIADERTVYFATLTATNGSSTFYGAGDYESYVPGFAYPIFCAGGRATTSATDRSSAFGTPASTPLNASGLINLMREYTGSVGVVTRSPVNANAGNSPAGNASAYPAPNAALSNAILSAPAMIGSAAGFIGKFRGLYLPTVAVSALTIPSTIAGSDAGSSLVLLRLNNSFATTNAVNNGGILVEAALPWQ